MFNLDAAVCTDVGKVRNNNEDNYYLCGKYKADTSQNNALLADQRAAAGTGLFNSSTVFAGLYYI